MSKLLIVESPGKIKKISEYLGHEYVVMASIGHIIDLDEKTMSINLETFEPEYKIYNDKIEVVNKLKKQTIIVGKENVLLAADEDREGEMIAWSLARELKINDPKRIVFNSITAKELTNAVSNPKLIDYNLVKAQQARRILDRLAGYLISPLLFKSGFKGAQSAGRVQSVVVKIIVDKEKEIINFYNEKKDTYFYITSNIKISDNEILTKLMNKSEKINLLNDIPEEQLEDLEDSHGNHENENNHGKEDKKNKSKKKNIVENTIKTFIKFNKSEELRVIEIIKNMVKSVFKIYNITEKVRKSNPSAPFTTSTLQQYASQRLGMDAKRTMSVAQKLYENGHITYMRTDSTAISEEAIKSIKEVIESKYNISYYEKHEYINKKANTQEAHECIRPTKPQYDDIEGSSDEKRLYNIIWKRTIQSQMKGAEYQNIMIEIDFEDRKEVLENYKLVGSLENLMYEGYLIVDGKKKSKPIDIKTLCSLEWLQINGIEDTIKPPVRYNDASLINKMDPKNLNIGRPSTYASFIDKIIKRKYVEIQDIVGKKIDVSKYIVKASNKKEISKENKELIIGAEKKKLVPTELGTNITNFLELYFKKLMDYKFTAIMEEELDEIAEGKVDKFKTINEFYKDIQQCILQVKPVQIGYTVHPIISLGNYNDKEITLNNGKYGKYITYDNQKYNLKQMIIEYNLDDTYESENNEKNHKLLYNKFIEKINKVKEDTKEWKIGKMRYILKNGSYGYYLEEISTITNKRKNNYSLKFLINKISKENSLDITSDINKVIDLINNDNIKDTVDYFNKTKK